ncbi:hypothetical protein NO2_0781 [Candidatus Termititenax persephonae]|uniref:Uncharacterized protein n=1 Tax=Candidatus Termititenax persephonae TaxID=2218525 RepID=A0A388THK5_9BACT|nr:hypothetical protein NO2_0781 [Candidatus Termititenax persephonae]
MSEINLTGSVPPDRDELRKSILDAVSGKENVISSFHGTKKVGRLAVDKSLEQQHYGLAYLWWNFLGGLFFGLGLLIMAMATVWSLSNFETIRAITGTFSKFVWFLQSLGR